MGYMARWGPKGFLVSPEKIVPIIELKTALSLDKDTGSLDSQEIELSTTYYRATGVDPRAQWDEWKSLVGKAHPFYIGDNRFGPKKMKLMGINLSDVLLANSGEFLAVTIGLIFSEAPDPPVAVSSGGGGSAGGGSGGGSYGRTGGTTANHLGTVPKAIIHDGLAATASNGDRVEHAPEIHVSSSGREHSGGSLGYVSLEHYLPDGVSIVEEGNGYATIVVATARHDIYSVGYVFPNGAVIVEKIGIGLYPVHYNIKLP